MRFNMDSVTIGADPEIFVGKRGEIISAHTLPFGSKAVPKPTPHGTVQVDGLALEVNVTPSITKIGFYMNCSRVIQDLEEMLKRADPEMYLTVKPTAFFTKKYLDSLPESAKELGCNPDWNAYELRENERPKADDVLFRTAGGHVHVGWGKDFNCTSLEHIADCAVVAKQLDYTLGLPSLDFDKDKTRRDLYGKAGAFRPKPYGMEYRVLSPMWLLNIQHTGLIWNGVQRALKLLNEDRVLDDEFNGLARSCIDSSEYNWREVFPELEVALAK